MLIFGLHDGERVTLEVSGGQTVKDVRQVIQSMFNISDDQYKHERKVLVLSWAGSELQDPWVFSDLGMGPGSTIRINLKEEVKPVLFLHCSYSQDTLPVVEMHQIAHLHLADMRSLASRMTGLPVSVFRLVTQEGTEMYDGHRLEDYGVDIGHTIYLQNVDGWNEFINLAIMGFTPQVVSQISQEEITGRYQMKVALWMAAHYGHVDLARAMLRQGVRASEPIGYPPQRMWCTEGGHVDSRKAAIHEAVEMGQLGVLRLFVHNDVTVLTAKDGNGLAPLNIALRKKMKHCATFLLTKQWAKVMVSKNLALHVGTYSQLKAWCERAKERTYTKYGQAKSSLKRRYNLSAPLVGFGVNVDGFSPSMTGKSRAQLQRVKDKDKKLTNRQWQQQMSNGATTDPESYFRHINALQALKAMGSKVKTDRWGRAASKANMLPDAVNATRSLAAWEAKPPRVEEAPLRPNKDTAATVGQETLSLPPILHKPRLRLLTHSQDSVTSVSVGSKEGVLVAEGENTAEGEKGSMMARLMKSRSNAFFMAGGRQPQGGKLRLKTESEQTEATTTSQKRPQRSSVSSISTVMTTGEEGEGEGGNLATSGSDSHLHDSFGRREMTTVRNAVSNEDVPTRPADQAKRKRKSRNVRRVTSALLLSKAKASEGTIPLPLISQEQNRRPFFYYNGLREDALVESALAVWARHATHLGLTPRQRAVRSLSVASTFRDKPWLGQVRIALRLLANPTHRSLSHPPPRAGTRAPSALEC